MVFHGQHPSGSKRSSIGRKYKKGHTHADHQIAVAEGLVNNVLVSGDSTLTDNPDAPTPPPKRKNDRMIIGEIIGEFKGPFKDAKKSLFGAELN